MITHMEPAPVPSPFRHIGIAIAEFLLLAFALPVGGALILAIPLPAVIALITSTLLIEYGAGPVGIGLGLDPLFVLVTITSIAAGVILLLFGIFDTLGSCSARVRGFLDRSKQRAEQSKLLSGYGMLGLVPCVIIFGFYVCPAVSWVFSWHRRFSILLTLAGYILVSVITILATLGIFRAFGWGA